MSFQLPSPLPRLQRPRRTPRALALALPLLAGCAVAPAPISVVDPAPEALEAFSPETVSAEPVAAEWWDGFHDPILPTLVELAFAQSPALNGADFQVAAAEAELRRITLDRSPDLTSQAGADVGRPAGPGGDPDASIDAALFASWELDAYGRIAALVDSAEASRDAIRQIRRDLAVTIASETALAYVDLRGAQRRLSVARQNADAQKEGLDLIAALRDNGRATQLDFDRSEAIYRTTLASIPTFKADIDAAVNRLSALTGQPATLARARFADLLEGESPRIPELAGPLAVGTPRALLRRRPDVRLAEADLAGALALTAAARADLFPEITLNANASALFNTNGDFFDEDGLGFSIGPALRWAGPDLRRVRANIDAADARAGIAAASYEQAVFDALSDVETALSLYINELSRRADLVAAAEASQRALALATLRFQEGLDDYLDVLDAQRTRLDAEDRLAASRLETARRAIRAYRSLGGIWDDDTLTARRAS
ncbi:MAG: TolC family protein [Pseudomonadota bacterium]